MRSKKSLHNNSQQQKNFNPSNTKQVSERRWNNTDQRLFHINVASLKNVEPCILDWIGFLVHDLIPIHSSVREREREMMSFERHLHSTWIWISRQPRWRLWWWESLNILWEPGFNRRNEQDTVRFGPFGKCLARLGIHTRLIGHLQPRSRKKP